MSDNKHSLGNPGSVDVQQIFIAEYNALRREIELLIEHQKDIVNFTILTIAAMAGLFGILKTEAEHENAGFEALIVCIFRKKVLPHFTMWIPLINITLSMFFLCDNVRFGMSKS